MTLLAHRAVFVFVVLWATIDCGIADADWPSDPTVNVALTTVAQARSNASSPVIVSDGAGGAIVTWWDLRNGNGDIFAQRVDAAGVSEWTADGVAICTAAGDQSYPTIVSDGSGGAIITWQDDRGGHPNSGTDIYAQRVNASGAPQWTSNGVAICSAVEDQRVPTVASDGAGGAIITWQDFRSGPLSEVKGYYDIYAQRVNASGVPQWTADGVALSTALGDQVSPVITSDGASGAIVAWEDRDHINNDEIFARRVNAAGVPQWASNGVVICIAPNNQQVPTIASDGAGGAVIAWQDGRSGTVIDAYIQRVNATGIAQWTANGVPVTSSLTFKYNTTVVSDGTGGAIVTWTDMRNGDADIYAQRVNATGIAVWNADGLTIGTVNGNQSSPAVIADGAGGAFIVWQDGRSGTSSDIYAQLVNGSGVAQWTADGVALCTAPTDQVSPGIALDGQGGAIVAWQDSRISSYVNIYAQSVNANGSLGNAVLSAPAPSVSASFALGGVHPNPSVGEMRVSFSLLDDSPATLALYDLTGRRIESQSVSSFGPGAQVTTLTSRASSLPPGIYCVILTQGSHHAFSKVAIVR